MPAELHPAPPSQRTRAIVGLLGANFFWGLSFPTIKALALVQERLVPDPLGWFTTAMLVAPRFVLAAAVLAVWQGLRGALFDITRNEWIQGTMIALFSSAGLLFQNDGLRFTEASTSAFLTQLYAILIPVYVAFRTGRNPGTRVWFCGLLVLSGVAILGRFDWQSLRFGRGEWETLVSSLFFMGQILWLEKKAFAANRADRITLVMFVVQALIFSAVVLATVPSPGAVWQPLSSPPWWAFTLILTLFCTLGAYLLMNRWQPKITATEAGLIYCIEPIFGSLMALFLPALFSAWALIHYPNETATWNLVVGGGLITLANVIIQLKAPPPRAG